MAGTTVTRATAGTFRLRVRDQVLAPDAVLRLLANEPERAARVLRDGVVIIAGAETLDRLRATDLGPCIGADGEVVTSAVTGAEEIIAAMIVGACIGFLAGLGLGLAVSDQDSETDGDGEQGTEDTGTADGGHEEGGTDPE